MRKLDLCTKVHDKVKKCLNKKNYEFPLLLANNMPLKNISDPYTVRSICIEQLGFDSNAVKVHTAKIKTYAKRTAVTKEIKEGRFQVVIVVKMLLTTHPSASQEL